jgi:hypothetical protein
MILEIIIKLLLLSILTVNGFLSSGRGTHEMKNLISSLLLVIWWDFSQFVYGSVIIPQVA